MLVLWFHGFLTIMIPVVLDIQDEHRIFVLSWLPYDHNATMPMKPPKPDALLFWEG